MLYLYSICIFLSAFLLFLVQPMIGKMFLPWVGGSAAAWNSCMFFFQALLMGGYCYTHFSVAKLGVKKQTFLQFPLMLVALVFLPISFSYSAGIPQDPSFWLIKQLFITIGIPFFVLSGISPLLQIWFAQTVHQRAENPFFLFAASNTGSLLALVIYPTMIEPAFNLSQQAKIWSWGYGILVVLMAACAWFIKTSVKADIISEPQSEETSPEPSKGLIAYWVLAAFIPSSLMLAVTQYLTTDLVPMPLFWVIPLIIYLVTFIIAFSDRIAPSAAKTRKAALFTMLAFVSMYLFMELTHFWYSLAVHLFTLFCVSLFCHRSIAETKPTVQHLTQFYIWISLGGVLGGLFNSILAPMLFAEFVEYPLLIILSCILIDRTLFEHEPNKLKLPKLSGWLTALMGVYVFAAIVFISTLNIASLFYNIATYYGFDGSYSLIKSSIVFIGNYHGPMLQILFILAALLPAMIIRKRYRVKFAPMMTVILALVFFFNIGEHMIVYRSRNFFGVKKVFYLLENSIRYLAHGSTIHGKQSWVEGWRTEPLTYYHRHGPLGDLFALPISYKPDLKVGVIGLGIGSMAAYSKPGHQFVFYEIDPQVVEIARQKDIFSYLHEFSEQCTVVTGDGRLKIAEADDGFFDLIIIDAFSSDAIPVHLLTIEAMQGYLEKLSQNGIIAAHVSNRYLDLQSNLQALARELSLNFAYIKDDNFDQHLAQNFERSAADYAIFTRDSSVPEYLAAISQGSWQKDFATSGYKAWTDSHSSIFPLLKRNMGK